MHVRVLNNLLVLHGDHQSLEQTSDQITRLGKDSNGAWNILGLIVLIILLNVIPKLKLNFLSLF